jgi:D-amino-acid oxidase
MKGIELLENQSQAYVDTEGRYKDIDDFRVLEEGELPSGVEWGAEYTTYCVNTPVYISHLMRRYILNGGKIIRKRLSSLHDAFTVEHDVRTVVNCSGVGFNDPKCFITRGILFNNCYTVISGAVN